MVACPPLEDIAAFLDGTLSPEERAHVTEHLARCESCYEIFAGAVHFQEEEGDSFAEGTGGGGVLPFPLVEEKPQEKHARVEPPRPARRVSRWLPLAASVVLAVGAGYMLWQRSQVLPEVTVAVVEPLQGKDGIGTALYRPDVERGGPGQTILPDFGASEFLIGVYLVDLRLRLSVPVRAGEEERTTEGILSDLAGTLEQLESMVSPELVTFFKNQSQQADLEILVRELPKHERALESELAEDPLFRFGIWTEAAHVFAKVHSPAFFEQRRNRRFLATIPREIPPKDEQYRPILDSLQKIEPLWDSSPRDYEALAFQFKNIVDQFDRIQKEDQEGFDPLLDN